MLSYLHGFHAGNFADVHKHHTLVALLTSLNRKEKPWSYLETHSGKAAYDLSDDQALKTLEFKDGISKLWTHPSVNESLLAYLECVKQCNGDELQSYPGSPAIAASMAREADKLHLMELHPNEVKVLKHHFRRDPRVSVHHRDGNEGVLSLLPPKPNRGLVLIDPSYEVKEEYEQVVHFITMAHKRWPIGTYAIWYPLLPANRWRFMLEDLRRTGIRNMLLSELHVKQPSEQGMYGSGMLIMNPPWNLEGALKSGVSAMVDLLKQDASAHAEVSVWVGE